MESVNFITRFSVSPENQRKKSQRFFFLSILFYVYFFLQWFYFLFFSFGIMEFLQTQVICRSDFTISALSYEAMNPAAQFSSSSMTHSPDFPRPHSLCLPCAYCLFFSSTTFSFMCVQMILLWIELLLKFDGMEKAFFLFGRF